MNDYLKLLVKDKNAQFICIKIHLALIYHIPVTPVLVSVWENISHLKSFNDVLLHSCILVRLMRNVSSSSSPFVIARQIFELVLSGHSGELETRDPQEVLSNFSSKEKVEQFKFKLRCVLLVKRQGFACCSQSFRGWQSCTEVFIQPNNIKVKKLTLNWVSNSGPLDNSFCKAGFTRAYETLGTQSNVKQCQDGDNMSLKTIGIGSKSQHHRKW